MNRVYSLMFLMFFGITLSAQIDPLTSPYYQTGSYEVEMLEDFNASPDLLIWKPVSNQGPPYPTVLFQPGANGFGSSAIDKHSYDIYLEHLASYGFVVLIINNTSGGPAGSLFEDMHTWVKNQVNGGESWMSTFIDLNRFIVAGHSNGGMNATDVIIDRPTEIHAIVYMASYPNPGDFWGFGSQNVSNYNGKVLLMCGSEDNTSLPLIGTTNNIARTAYNNRFTSASCKTWAYFNGVGHGGFGDYDNSSQPVGSLGREPVTASIRHILVSFLMSQFHLNYQAYNNLNDALLRPNSLGEFDNTCGFAGQPEYTLSLSAVPENGGQVSGAGDYMQGSQVEIEATANQGFDFIAWKDGSGNTVSVSSTFTFNMPAENTTLFAHFDVQSSVFLHARNNILMYPNPASTEVYVEAYDATEIEIFDMFGELVYCSKISRRAHIAIQSLQPGVYVVAVKTTSAKRYFRLVVQ